MSKDNKTEKFIEKARVVHGNKYDYSKVEYINNSTNIKIICPIHGEFEQTPAAQLSGKGCRKCSTEKNAIKKSFTTEKFIEKSKSIHGDKYDYSKIEYTGIFNKVKIICPIHGEFEQVAKIHMDGGNCQRCSFIASSINKKSNTENFILKAKEKHGDKYDYSETEYISAKTKVKIFCKEHNGFFYQQPSNHLYGFGCNKCSGRDKTNEDFIKQAKLKHGDKYDYSLTNYESGKKKVKIICPIHGVFEQTATDHFVSGCLECGGKKQLINESFIEKSNIKHNNKYDYSKVNYINARSYVTIICPEHGEFTQGAGKHMNGDGCPKCAGKGIKYKPFIEARDFIRNLGFKSSHEWFEYCKSGNKPEDIPTHPDFVYKKKK